MFKDMIQHGIELENAKIRLIQHQDFNMLDAFQIIDVNQKGWITSPQLQETL